VTMAFLSCSARALIIGLAASNEIVGILITPLEVIVPVPGAGR
jgi:hypothetical protein